MIHKQDQNELQIFREKLLRKNLRGEFTTQWNYNKSLSSHTTYDVFIWVSKTKKITTLTITHTIRSMGGFQFSDLLHVPSETRIWIIFQQCLYCTSTS